MIDRIGKLTMKATLAAVMGLAVTFAATPVNAQSRVLNAPHYEDVPGCNDDIKDLMKTMSQFYAIRDVQLTEEELLKPESVFHMTCFARNGQDQIRNAAVTRRDRWLWNAGSASRHADRADRKVRTWSINTWLRNNYDDNIIANEVVENCTSLQSLWTFLTGNGAQRIMLERAGTPNPGAGVANRPDRDFYFDVEEIWTPPPVTPTDAWGVQDQWGSVIQVNDNNIDALEQDIFSWTNNIQNDIIDIGYRPFTRVENPAFGCTGNECLTSQDLLDLFNNIQP